MTAAMKCPKCGAELPADAPAGICPKCLLRAGLASAPDRTDAEQTAPRHSRFVPPEPEVLSERFPTLEILELLGTGGMGAVYKARQPGLDRLVAVKILPPEVGADPAFAERFTREARALGKLSHQNIVSVFDFGHADGLYYFVMEYVDGTNLRQVIETAGMKPSEALAVIPQICEALQFAHDQGIVHRDIKPENILLDRQGRVKIADFGLAKLLGRAPTDFTLTGTHQVMGTWNYMAPEQMQGSHAVDHRADIYSLGVVFYELLTGQLPRGRFDLPSQKVQLDVRLDEVVLRTLEHEPERRYQQASELKTAVQSFAASEAPPPSRLAESPGAQVDLEMVRRQIQGPAIGLLVVGVLNCLPMLLVLLKLLLVPFFLSTPITAPQPDPLPMETSGVFISGTAKATQRPVALLPVILAFLGLVYYLPAAVVMILGGLKMRQLDSYGLVVFASAIALVPCNVASILGMAVGIWALVVLMRPEVKAAFGLHAKQRLESTGWAQGGQGGEERTLKPQELESIKRKVAGPAIGLLIVALLLFLPLILIVVTVVYMLLGA